MSRSAIASAGHSWRSAPGSFALAGLVQVPFLVAFFSHGLDAAMVGMHGALEPPPAVIIGLLGMLPGLFAGRAVVWDPWHAIVATNVLFACTCFVMVTINTTVYALAAHLVGRLWKGPRLSRREATVVLGGLVVVGVGTVYADPVYAWMQHQRLEAALMDDARQCHRHDFATRQQELAAIARKSGVVIPPRGFIIRRSARDGDARTEIRASYTRVVHYPSGPRMQRFDILLSLGMPMVEGEK